jgi:3beta-hydroxy-delta5-steroid dehydrogenase/steroid delta-isomerase
MKPLPLDAFTPADVGQVCLVTGGAGYLGRHLVDALLTIGCTVRVLDMAPCPRDDVEVLQGDIRDEALLARATEGVDTVFHAAAIISLLGVARASVRDKVFGINTRGTERVVAACRAAGVRRLVYTSSANVVIDRELVEADESAPYASTWIDLYGESKAQAEAQVLDAHTTDGLRTIALRPGGIWGGGDGGFMIRAFLDQVATGAFVATIGDGTAVVDNTHVRSLVYAELLAAKALTTRPDEVGGQPYFITDDERINGITWFRPITEGLDLPWPRRALPGRLMYGLAWLLEWSHDLGAPEPPLTRIGIAKLIRSSAFRIDRARNELGYEPLVKHEEGLRHHLDDYRRAIAARKEHR